MFSQYELIQKVLWFIFTIIQLIIEVSKPKTAQWICEAIKDHVSWS